MRPALYAAVFILGALVSFFVLRQRVSTLPRQNAQLELLHARSALESQLASRNAALDRQLAAFADQVAGNRDFAMKLLVEADRTAPEVTEIAGRYMTAMGLSMLDVIDQSDTILSSGQNPTAAGTSGAERAAVLTSQPTFMLDMVDGRTVLTLQARAVATVGDSARITCAGGWVVDSAMLCALTPLPGIRLLLRAGDLTLGIDSVASMSEVRNNTMLLNDTMYLATTIDLPYSGEGTAPRLYLLSTVPPAFSLF